MTPILPPCANIQREFRHLAEASSAGDQVVVFLSGHGSQQPDQAPFDEDDRLDEIFLPCDIGYWNGKKMTVENAIIDDELNVWLEAICRKGAKVWLIADSCCSGTMIRGRGRSIPRWIPPGELIPKEVLDKETARAERSGHTMVEDLGRLDGLVSLCAAPPDEATFEDPLPGSGSPYYGRLTFTLVQILKGPHPPLTYWEVARRISFQYDASQWYHPSPMLEGHQQERDCLVLGEQDRNPCRFELTHNVRGQFKLKAGALHGLTVGTILAVKAPLSDDVTGHVQIVASGLGSLESEVEPCTAAGQAVRVDLPIPGFCRVTFLEYGDLRVKVAVDRDAGLVESTEKAIAKKLDTHGLARLEAALRQAASRQDGSESVVMHVQDPSEAEWLVRATGPAADRAVLIPATAWASGQHPPEVLGPFDARPEEIADRVFRIARVRNLLRITSAPTELLNPVESTPRLDVEILRMKDDTDRVGEHVRLDPCMSFRVGDIIGLRIKNLGPTPLDVTMLWIDGNFGITAVFPNPEKPGQDNRVRPGEPLLRRFEIVDKGLGHEHVVVIAIAPRQLEDFADFSFLADPQIADTSADSGIGASREAHQKPSCLHWSRSCEVPCSHTIQLAGKERPNNGTAVFKRCPGPVGPVHRAGATIERCEAVGPSGGRAPVPTAYPAAAWALHLEKA